MRVRKERDIARPGAALVELAVLLPLLAFLFVIGVDFARLFYHQLTITKCARCGAIYGSRDEPSALDTAGIEKAALADATNLTPMPTVTSSTGLDESGFPCVRVKVQWKFDTVTRFPGVPTSMDLVRTVQMRIAPKNPKNSDL